MSNTYNMRKPSTLSRQIISLYSILMIVLIGALVLQSILFYYPQILSKTYDFLQEKNNHLKTFIEGYFKEIINSVKILAANEDIIEVPYKDAAARRRALAVFKEFQQVNHNIYYIYAGYTNNLLLINDYEPPPGYQVFSRPWYKSIMDEPAPKKMVVGLLYEEIKTKEKLLSTTHILTSPEHGHTGVIAIDSYIQSIVNEIKQFSEQFTTSYSYITSKDLTLLIHADEALLGKNLLTLIETKDNIKSGSFFRYTFRGVQKIGFVTYLDITDWYIFTIIDNKEIVLPIIKNLFMYFLLTTLIIVVFAMLNIYEFRRLVIMPLNILLKHVGRLAESTEINKEEPHTLPSLPNNQIGNIAKNIDKLTTSALYRKNQELLEAQNKLLALNQELKEKNIILENLAIHDFLTNIYNRRKIEEMLINEYNRYERYRIPFSLILFDIDGFKTINDRYGHKNGDDVLKIITKMVKENIRKSDMLGRWGGEEFLIILFKTTAAEAYDVAEKIRCIIANVDFALPAPVTISLGVAEYNGNEKLDELVNRVDACLYEAKRRGKNNTYCDVYNLKADRESQSNVGFD